MSKYEVGDRVFVQYSERDDYWNGPGTIQSIIGGGTFEVALDSDRVGGFVDSELRPLSEPAPDDVNHPTHYRQYPVEVIEITERLSFLMGNIVKYVLRADHKGEPIKDLKKARWYLDREIARREADPTA